MCLLYIQSILVKTSFSQEQVNLKNQTKPKLQLQQPKKTDTFMTYTDELFFFLDMFMYYFSTEPQYLRAKGIYY